VKSEYVKRERSPLTKAPRGGFHVFTFHVLLLALAASLVAGRAAVPGRLASPEEVIASKTDLWGEVALAQPGGPSYEFFENLLPPLRYVDTDFVRYPIVLSAPGSTIKGRLVSDGSVINALARQPNWRNEMGIPVHVLVGRERHPFGSDLGRLTGPMLAGGYLPIVRLVYRENGLTYGEEVFASGDEKLPGAIMARFDFPAANQGRIELRIEAGPEYLTEKQRCVRDASGRVIVAFDENWEFNTARSCLLNTVKHGPSGVVLVVTPQVEIISTPGTVDPMKAQEEPVGQFALAAAPAPLAISDIPPIGLEFYDQQREQAVSRWGRIVARGADIQVPEALVNNAWRALIVQQYEILHGDQLNYSAGNQYARQYSNECGDSMRSLLLYGHTETAARVIPPLFVYRRPGIELHDGAFKLELLADYYLATRDAKLIRDTRELWQREVDLILRSRDRATGLLPRERYCSDVATPIISLNNNANCWRGLRDMAVVLDEIGEKEQAAKLAAICMEYRKVILAAMDKAIVRTVDPPFVPVALSGEEPPPDPITSTRLGSYWNLVIPCVLWSGIFPIDSEPADAIMHYIQRKGGLCMGLTRVQSARGPWVNTQNIDDLYVLRYALALLKRDEPNRALVGFYAKLAQGFTRDTFYDGESSSIEPLDAFGRQFGLPPNSTANASFLLQLRNLLVQDWDMDDDGKPETLRLLYATPRRWLEAGKQIVVSNAPTAFGPVSMRIGASKDGITAELSLPPRKPQRTIIRFRAPDGWKTVAASSNDQPLPLAGTETFDISALGGKCVVRVRLEPGKP
jgi:hypothetical protein